MPKSSILDQHGEKFTITEMSQGYAPTLHRLPFPSRDGSVRAYFDPAVPTADNAAHWAMAVPSHANVAASRDRRLRTRNQARYETLNNCWLNGIVDTLALETIGELGPSLQMSPDLPEDMRRDIEETWASWAIKARLAEKLLAGRRAKAVDGEAFYMLVSDPLLTHDIKLNVKLIEADQVGNPWETMDDPWHYDGVRISEAGEPVEYHVYRTHPYDIGPHQLYPEGDWYYATRLVQLHNIERPGQLRGITELLPCLSLAAILRRFTYATLHAAEKAADISLLMHTSASPDDPDGCEKPYFGSYEPVPFERNMIVNLPYGWDAKQVQAEHPGNNYVEFVRQIVIEMGRALSMPASVSLGDSSAYNYASGRLDFQAFARAIEAERKQQIEAKLLSALFYAFLQEYVVLRSGASPFSVRMEQFKHSWYWQPRKTDDPEKQAQASTTLMEAGLMSDEEYWLEHGKDPETQRAMLERQNTWREAHGFPTPGNQPGMKPLQDGSNARPSTE